MWFFNRDTSIELQTHCGCSMVETKGLGGFCLLVTTQSRKNAQPKLQTGITSWQSAVALTALGVKLCFVERKKQFQIVKL